MQLDQAFWDERWRNGQTGWDMRAVAPITADYFKNIANKNIKILIPGCGNAYEAELLAELGFTNITLIDISPTVINILKEKFKDIPSIRLIHGNFFDIEEKDFDMIFEQTFFCAIDPKLRADYGQNMYNLLKKDGILVGLLFNRTFSHQGPPFGGSAEEYTIYFDDKFDYLNWEMSEGSIPPRMGTELFIELRKK